MNRPKLNNPLTKEQLNQLHSIYHDTDSVCKTHAKPFKMSTMTLVEKGSGYMYGLAKKYARMSPESLDVIIDIIDDEILFLSDLSHIPYVNRKMNKLLDLKKEVMEAQALVLCDMEESQNATR